MNENDIRRYASLMDELGLSALEIKDDGLSVRMEKDKQAPAVPKAETEPRSRRRKKAGSSNRRWSASSTGPARRMQSHM